MEGRMRGRRIPRYVGRRAGDTTELRMWGNS